MNSIKKYLNKYKILALLLGCIILLITIFWPEHFTYTYLKRIALYRESDINDYKIFSSREFGPSKKPFYFAKSESEVDVQKLFKDITYKYNGRDNAVNDFEDLLNKTKTTSFIIIKNDKILYEKYFNGYARDSVNTSVSMAKSFTSALIGIAIDDGYIESEDDAITKYIPELKDKDIRFESIKIKDLLSMNSGIKYSEGPMFFGDDAFTYYSEDLRKLALNIKYESSPGNEFLYNNYNPLLLGMILERSTGRSVSDYLNDKIWKDIGTEYSGSWSLDDKDGFEKMESGINARSIDFAKFGRLFLHKGAFDGKQVISTKWIDKSIKVHDRDSKYYQSLTDWNVDLDKTFYGYMWWGYKRNNAENDFYARGKYGQYIYVSPSTNTIIVRNGIDAGEVDFWPEILYQITNLLP
jgi:CubicO group peptidase (beta-lactamase class C family)